MKNTEAVPQLHRRCSAKPKISARATKSSRAIPDGNTSPLIIRSREGQRNGSVPGRHVPRRLVW